MSFNRRSYCVPILTVLFAALLLFSACDSPLTVETPRNRMSDRVSIPLGEDIGSAVSVDLTPPDTTYQPRRFSAALLFDASESVTQQLTAAFKQAGNVFLDSLNGWSDEASVSYFSQNLSVKLPLTTSVPLLRQALENLPASGVTAIWDALYFSLLELQSDATHERKAVIVILDGKDNASGTGAPASIISFGKQNGIAVYIIAMTVTADEPALQVIAQETGGTYYPRPTLSSLPEIYRQIAGRLKKP